MKTRTLHPFFFFSTLTKPSLLKLLIEIVEVEVVCKLSENDLPGTVVVFPGDRKL